MIDLQQLNKREAMGLAALPAVAMLLNRLMTRHNKVFEDIMDYTCVMKHLPPPVLAEMVAGFITLANDFEAKIDVSVVKVDGERPKDADQVRELLKDVAEALAGGDVTKH